MSKEVILTGLRSNSEFHLGNYLGAILPMVHLQKEHAGQYQLNMFIPDLHGLVTPVDHRILYQQTIRNLKFFVAAGLDIDQPDTFIYRQSHIPAHSELTWILDCFTHYNEVHRMTQFKEKSGLSDSQIDEVVDSINEQMDKDGVWEQINRVKDLSEQKQLLELATKPFIREIRHIVRKKGEQASVGLLNYPVLMAADILLYGAVWVPVGEDQRQHLELTRNLAIRFNNQFEPLLSIPHDWDRQLKFTGLDRGIRIRSLRNPEKKMSKSVEDPSGTIMLNDSPDVAADKVVRAATDSIGSIEFDWDKQPGVANLLQILAMLSGEKQDQINKQWVGQSSYNELKSKVAEVVRDSLTDLQTKLTQIDETKVLQKLKDDEQAMGKVAETTLFKVQQAVGLRPKT